MKKPYAICLEPLSEGTKSLLSKALNDKVDMEYFNSVEEGESKLAEADAIVVFTKGIKKETLEKAPKCKIVQKLGAGYDKIDREQINKMGAYLTVAKGVNARSVAEHAVLLMMATYKRLIVAHNSLLAGKWYKTQLRDYSYEVSGKTVGLIGVGNIGREVCKLLKGFGCSIYYYDLFRLSADEEQEYNARYCTVEELLQYADIVSLHVALTDQTREMINAERIALMKNTAILVNTCRGEVVDEDALYQALADERILGAGLDVFNSEPLDPYSKLRTLNNVVLSPHIGGGTMDAIRRVAEISADNIIRAVNGQEPQETNIIRFN